MKKFSIVLFACFILNVCCLFCFLSAKHTRTHTACYVSRRNNMLAAGDWLVVVGTVSIADVSLGKRYRALQVIPHPRFNKYNNDYDVGLLHTVTDMDMTGERRRDVAWMGEEAASFFVK